MATVSWSIDVREICSFIIGIITVLLIGIIFIHFVNKEYDFKKYRYRFWKLRIDAVFAMIIMICFLGFAVVVSMASFYSIISALNGHFELNWCIIHWNEYYLWIFGKFCVFQFFIIRLHQVFTDTAFEISTIRLKIMSVTVWIPNIGQMILMNYAVSGEITKFITNPSNNYNIQSIEDCDEYFESNLSDLSNKLLLIGVMVYLLNEIIFSIIILRLFLKRIIFLSLSIKETTNKNKTSLINKELFNLSIKTTNLMIIAFITNFLILLYQTPIPVSIFNNIDGIFSCLSIYLSFKSTRKYYDKLFSSLHHHCYGFCVTLCFCCCAAKKLPDHIQLEMNQNHQNRASNIEWKTDGIENKSKANGTEITATTCTSNITLDMEFVVGRNTAIIT